MSSDNLIRCVSITTGKVRMLIPMLANNPDRLKKLGFIKAEIEAPVIAKTVLVPPDIPIAPPPASEPKIKVHKVKDGETFAKIAKQLGMKTAELKELNGITSQPINKFSTLKVA